jgi:hypothetical protein
LSFVDISCSSQSIIPRHFLPPRALPPHDLFTFPLSSPALSPPLLHVIFSPTSPLLLLSPPISFLCLFSHSPTLSFPLPPFSSQDCYTPQGK